MKYIHLLGFADISEESVISGVGLSILQFIYVSRRSFKVSTFSCTGKIEKQFVQRFFYANEKHYGTESMKH